MGLWTPDNSSVPPSKGHTANRAEASKRTGLRQGTLGCKGEGRRLMQSLITSSAPRPPDAGITALTALRRNIGTVAATKNSTCPRFALR